MHILLIHQAFVSPQEAGGTRHYELAQRVVADGHNFTLVASPLSYLTGKRTTETQGLVTEQMVDGVRVLRAWTPAMLHKGFVWRIMAFISFMLTSVVAAWRAGTIDLVMGTSPPIFQAFSAWLIAFLRRRPFLLEIRDLWPAFAIEMGVLRNPILIRLSRWLERFLYARATHLLVNSPAYRDYLLTMGVPASKITLIPNGADITQFDPTSTGATFRQQWHLTNKFVITYAGALGPANDLPTLLQAAAQLKDQPEIHFLLVGDGASRPALEQLAGELGLTQISFTGARPKAEMGEILAASDLCVAILQDIPMFRTTYPNKVFDYMAAGRATLLAIDGVIRQVVEEGCAGIFVPPGNPTELAKAVRYLYDHPQECRQMGNSARQHVSRHFNRSHQATQFLQLLNSLTNDN